jgi:hypothetical protein
VKDGIARRIGRWIVRAIPVAALGLLFAPLPTGWLGVWQGQLLDFGHVPLFAALVVALRTGWGAPLWMALLGAISLAGLVEVGQPLVGRNGDWADFFRGCAGALSAAVAIRARNRCASRARRAGYAALAVTLLAGPVIEVAPFFADTVDGYRAFPVLADFSTDRQLLRWERDQTTLARTEGGGRLEFVPGPGEYASAALRPMRSDFSDHRWLCAELHVTDAPLDLFVSIRTGMNAGGTTHVDVEQRYAVGAHAVRLDLAALAARGRPAPLDRSDVRYVIFFVIRPREPRAIVLTRVWLEP